MEPKDAPADPFGGFVVETTVKPDGRLIHYYEWPQPAAEDLPTRDAPATKERTAEAVRDV